MRKLNWSEQGWMIMAAFFAGIAAAGVTFILVVLFMEIVERLWV